MNFKTRSLGIVSIGMALSWPAHALSLQEAIERVFGKLEQRIGSVKQAVSSTEVTFEMKDPYGSMEVLLNAAGVQEASSNGGEPNGLSSVGLVDLDADGIEELVLLFNTSNECSTQSRCLTLVYKAQDASKKNYRRVFSGFTQLKAGNSHHTINRGVGKMRAIESRKDGRVVDRFEP